MYSQPTPFPVMLNEYNKRMCRALEILVYTLYTLFQCHLKSEKGGQVQTVLQRPSITLLRTSMFKMLDLKSVKNHFGSF